MKSAAECLRDILEHLSPELYRAKAEANGVPVDVVKKHFRATWEQTDRGLVPVLVSRKNWFVGGMTRIPRTWNGA
jgi:hypothetical protein